MDFHSHLDPEVFVNTSSPPQRLQRPLSYPTMASGNVVYPRGISFIYRVPLSSRIFSPQSTQHVDTTASPHDGIQWRQYGPERRLQRQISDERGCLWRKRRCNGIWPCGSKFSTFSREAVVAAKATKLANGPTGTPSPAANVIYNSYEVTHPVSIPPRICAKSLC